LADRLLGLLQDDPQLPFGEVVAADGGARRAEVGTRRDNRLCDFPSRGNVEPVKGRFVWPSVAARADQQNGDDEPDT
jgi:hypothetical protein